MVGAAAVASLAAFVPTPDECAKVTSFVQKKHAQQLHQLEEQKRKEKELFEKGAQGGGEEGGNAADGAAEDTAKPKGTFFVHICFALTSVFEKIPSFASFNLGHFVFFAAMNTQLPSREVNCR